MESISQQAANLRESWETDQRWAGISRDYCAEDVIRLRGSVVEEHTLAKRGARRLWELLHTQDAVRALGAITGNQAVQQVKAGLQAIYLSGWQVAADGNLAGHTYPDQSLYPVNSVPQMVRRINNALLRADQIAWSERSVDSTAPRQQWLAPIVADAEAGFGGVLNAFELMKSMIEAGAAGVHFEDQLSSEKKCGHLGGKVLIPTGQHIKTLTAARLAADVLDVPSLVTSWAALASVRASRIVGTPITSAASRAAVRFLTAVCVGTSTLPPMWPHFLAEDNWSSKCTPAAPASISCFISSKAFSTPPKPASASATIGLSQSMLSSPSA